MARWSRVVVCVAMNLIVAAAASHAADGPSATLDQIAEAWRRREARVRSGDFRWTEVRVLSRAPGELSVGAFEPSPGSEPAGTITDRETYEQGYDRELQFDGSKVRFADTQPRLYVDHGRYLPHESVDVCDGRVYKRLDGQHVPGAFRHQGAILPLESDHVYHLIDLKPLYLHFRVSRYGNEFLRQYAVAAGHGMVDGTRCVILRRTTQPTVPVVESLWLDPEQDFSVRRILRKAAHVVTSQWDISYEQDPAHGPLVTSQKARDETRSHTTSTPKMPGKTHFVLHDWPYCHGVIENLRPLPAGWKRVDHFPNGEFDRSVEATIVEARVNCEFPADRFTLEFPVDTLVYDTTGPAGTEPVEYIQREGGKKRIILDEEWRRAKTVEDLTETETGLAGIHEKPRSWSWRWGVAGALILVTLLVSLRLWRKHAV